MKYYPFPEKRGWKLGIALFLLLQLALTRSGMSATLLGFAGSQALMLGTLLAAGCVFLVHNRRTLKEVFLDRRLAAAAVFALILLLPMAAKQDWQMMYVTLLLGLFFGVFVSYFSTLQETAKYYVLTLCVLGVYSIAATYLLRRLPDAGILAVPTFTNSMGHKFYHFGLSHVSIDYVASRNFGIFREPGVHQFFLMIGIYLAFYQVPWKKESHMWLAGGILAATMVSTMATGGFIELGLFVVVMFLEKKLYRDKRLRLAAIALCIAGLVVVIISFLQKNSIYWFIYDTLLEKFINKTDSVTERTDAIVTNIRMFLENPVFGAEFSRVLHSVNNNTSSTLILYAALGFLGGTLNVAGWTALVWRRDRQL